METSFNPSAPEPARRRWLPWVIGVVVLLLLGLALAPGKVTVETATVAEGPLTVTVNEEGRTRVKHRFTVAAPAAGQLRRVEFKAGAPVQAGLTVLATLETGAVDLLDARALDQSRARVAGASSQREQAVARARAAAAQAELASAELKRIETLSGVEAVAIQELDAARARAAATNYELRAAEFGIQTAEQELTQAEAMLRSYQPESSADSPILELKSPVDGRVLRVFEESARAVQRGTPILEVGDPHDLEIVIEVLSREAVAIRPGATVWLERWGGDHPLEARVRWVEPSAFTKISALGVEEQRVNVIADLVSDLSLRGSLGDGFRVETRTVTWETEKALLVPAGALFQRDGGWKAFVVEGGRAAERAVEPGPTDGTHFVVEKGLSAGETVIVYPGDKVRSKVRIRSLRS